MDFHGLKLLNHCFKPATHERANDERDIGVLMCDEHDTHVISAFLAHTLDLLLLPPHSSHLTQSLNVDVFIHPQLTCRKIESLDSY